mgnify:CR=1 FL=1|jgi:phosphomannomutase
MSTAYRSSLIVSVSGIRGLVGKSFTDDTVHGFASAYGTALKPGARVVLARDTRPSGADFSTVAAAALRKTGCVVLDLGVCSTPGAKVMIAELDADAGIVLTASHNPTPWNGLKLIRGDGMFLNDEQGKRVAESFRSGLFHERAGGRVETVAPEDTLGRHLRRILASVDAHSIRRAGLTATVDPCNGVGGILLPRLLAELGVKARFINAETSGRFAHNPEPTPENLQELGRAVLAGGSNLGFAIDPDADRVALVGEDGHPVGEDYSLALAVQTITLRPRRRGPVVTTLSTSQIVTDAARRNACPVFLTAVGEVHVTEKMRDEQAVIGGEGNGGIIIAAVVPGRDAALGTALLLEALASAPGHSLQSLVEKLPTYFIEKRKQECGPDSLGAACEALLRKYPKAFVHPVSDGVKLYMSGDALECPWIHLRLSNTEPIARIIAEAATAEEASRLCDEAEELLRGE